MTLSAYKIPGIKITSDISDFVLPKLLRGWKPNEWELLGLTSQIDNPFNFVDPFEGADESPPNTDYWVDSGSSGTGQYMEIESNRLKLASGSGNQSTQKIKSLLLLNDFETTIPWETLNFNVGFLHAMSIQFHVNNDTNNRFQFSRYTTSEGVVVNYVATTIGGSFVYREPAYTSASNTGSIKFTRVGAEITYDINGGEKTGSFTHVAGDATLYIESSNGVGFPETISYIDGIDIISAPGEIVYPVSGSDITDTWKMLKITADNGTTTYQSEMEFWDNTRKYGKVNTLIPNLTTGVDHTVLYNQQGTDQEAAGAIGVIGSTAGKSVYPSSKFHSVFRAQDPSSTIVSSSQSGSDGTGVLLTGDNLVYHELGRYIKLPGTTDSYATLTNVPHNSVAFYLEALLIPVDDLNVDNNFLSVGGFSDSQVKLSYIPADKNLGLWSKNVGYDYYTSNINFIVDFDLPSYMGVRCDNVTNGLTNLPYFNINGVEQAGSRILNSGSVSALTTPSTFFIGHGTGSGQYSASKIFYSAVLAGPKDLNETELDALGFQDDLLEITPLGTQIIPENLSMATITPLVVVDYSSPQLSPEKLNLGLGITQARLTTVKGFAVTKITIRVPETDISF